MSTKDGSVFEDYLRDTGALIREFALEAKSKVEESGRSDFSVGYMAGFHRVVSLMQQQAAAFNIPVEKLALNGLDPDEELV